MDTRTIMWPASNQLCALHYFFLEIIVFWFWLIVTVSSKISVSDKINSLPPMRFFLYHYRKQDMKFITISVLLLGATNVAARLNEASPNRRLVTIGALNDIGDECQDKRECKTERCFQFFGVVPYAPKQCTCNEETNAGCNEDRNCLLLDHILPDIAPRCYVPVGGNCEDDFDCDTFHCFEGTCQCNPHLQDGRIGCEGDDRCLGNEEDGYRCEAPTPNSNACVRTINDELENYLLAHGFESCETHADCPVSGCCRRYYCMCDTPGGLCDGFHW